MQSYYIEVVHARQGAITFVVAVERNRDRIIPGLVMGTKKSNKNLVSVGRCSRLVHSLVMHRALRMHTVLMDRRRCHLLLTMKHLLLLHMKVLLLLLLLVHVRPINRSGHIDLRDIAGEHALHADRRPVLPESKLNKHNLPVLLIQRRSVSGCRDERARVLNMVIRRPI